MGITFIVDGTEPIECREVRGVERLGELSTFDLLLVSPEPLTSSSFLGKPCVLGIQNGAAHRPIAGVITQWTTLVTSQATQGRRYKAVVRPLLAVVQHRTRSRIFQDITIPNLVKKILVEAGYPDDHVKLRTMEEHAARQYVVQYAENDALFVRRMCEEEGLFFRFEAADDGSEIIVVEDCSSDALPGLTDKLPLTDAAALGPASIAAFDAELRAKRRPGKVTLRDYDQEKPALKLESNATAGTDTEKTVEVYQAPGGFKTSSVGDARAKKRLEALRADSVVLTFRSTAVNLAPGLSLEIEPGPDYSGSAQATGKYVVVAVTHEWTPTSGPVIAKIQAIPLDLPFRLPNVTPKPRLAGIQSAFVTGASGEEIHTDNAGRITVQFPWDLEGEPNDKSSLPVRVMQANMPGSMAIPRVGWEVMVAFEDGDPDRPLVVSRTYNGKFAPPYQLPANKTVTALQSYSSPGGGGTNSIRFDDAAGKEHVFVNAQFGKSKKVSNNLMTQTANNENTGITGSQSRTVSANENVSVTQAYLTAVGSQSATVGGSQKIYVKGKTIILVGSESVMVGAAVLEKVGDPVTGLTNLGKAAVLSGVGAAGTWGAVAAAVGGAGMAAVEGYRTGGWRGALSGAGMSALGVGAGMIPGGDAILSTVQGIAQPAPWEAGAAPPGDSAGGGGGSGASDSSAAAGPGPGHRNTGVKGAMMEMIGSTYAAVSPGNVGWHTVGASTFLIAGSYSTKAARGGVSVLGASTETLGSLKIETKGPMSRDVKGPINTQIAGSLKSVSKAKHTIKSAASISLTVAGSLTMKGAKVSFNVGGTTVTASDSGVLIDAANIKINNSSKQSGETGHT
ncbi:MAG: type VI secretion system tip protein VgrG [Polyangiaceae bacterium]|nr:type VI secretion system tip protein VgrG [Polyangiaceae bacterium]